jgi:hypothetical protein
MIIIAKTGEKITLNLEGAQLLTKDTTKGNLLVEIRDKEGNFVGLVVDPQAILS